MERLARVYRAFAGHSVRQEGILNKGRTQANFLTAGWRLEKRKITDKRRSFRKSLH